VEVEELKIVSEVVVKVEAEEEVTRM